MKPHAEILAELSVTEAICRAATPAHLLTHARTALPEYAAIVRELLAEVERLRGLLKDCVDPDDGLAMLARDAESWRDDLEVQVIVERKISALHSRIISALMEGHDDAH